jgi:putative ABC transport system permease protein
MAIPISYNLRNLRVRKTTTAMTALGIALTVAVLSGILALVNGIKGALEVTGNPLHVLITRQGSTAELTSVIGDEKFQVVRFMEGIERLDGEPMASHELVTVMSLPLRGNPTEEVNVNVRGISPMGIKMRDYVSIVPGGRWFQPGRREVVIGRGLQSVHEGVALGDKIEIGRGQWEIVGVLNAGKSAFNSEIWCDANLLGGDLSREANLSSILVRAKDAVTAQSLISRATGDQRLLLEGILETGYYARQTQSAAPVQTLGIFVAIIMAVGSSFAAMNTMYAAVARRAKEVGVLRLLGFSRGSIMVSFLLESLLLSLLGGVLGCLLILPLNGLESRIGNMVTFSHTTFEFEISPSILAIGLLFSAVMGVIGGLLPARMAARREVLSSLRDL